MEPASPILGPMFTYTAFVAIIAKLLFGLGVLAGVVCAVDWTIRTRKISPFNPVSRFFRRAIDPLMRPIETMIVRRGGQPASAPVWTFVGVAVVGIAVLQTLNFIGGLLMEISVGMTNPRYFGVMIASWAFRFVMFALIVRVLSSWLPISPFSRWIRWSYVTTEWLIAPLRRVVPTFGPIDVTPLIAYVIVAIAQSVLGLSGR